MRRMFCKRLILYFAKNQKNMTLRKLSFLGIQYCQVSSTRSSHKKKRSKIYFSNELVETLASEEFDGRTHQLTQRALQICYELLPDHMREISRLRFKEDLSMKEISKRIQRPIGAISGTLFRIRQNLVQCVRIKLPKLEAESEL